MLKARQQHLLALLNEKLDQYHLTQTLAEQFYCSERTIRNDLNALDEHLSKTRSHQLIRSPGKGIKLICLASSQHSQHDLTQGKSQQEDIKKIAYYLLMAREPLTIQHLSEYFLLSKHEIKEELTRLSDWIARFRLSLKIKQGQGVRIHGKELHIRQALMALDQLVDDNNKLDAFNLYSMAPYEVDGTKRILRHFLTMHNYHITEESMKRLTQHILLMVKRSKMKAFVTITNEDKSLIHAMPVFQELPLLIEPLANFFNLTFCEDEILYLAMHLSGAKFTISKKEKHSFKRIW